MKKDFNVGMKEMSGDPVKRGEVVVLQRTLICEALLAQMPDDRSTGEQKYKKFQLYNKVNVDGEVDLAVDELALIKEVIGKLYSPIVVGQIYDNLNK